MKVIQIMMNNHRLKEEELKELMTQTMPARNL